MTFPLSALELCRALRDRNHPDWPNALKCLTQLIRRHLARSTHWVRAREIGEPSDPHVAEELAHEFWLMLQDNIKALDVAAVQGYGAVNRQIVRFLRQPKSVSLEAAEGRLRQHFDTKLRNVLRQGDFVEVRRGVWGIAGQPITAADGRLVHDLQRRVPDIPGAWTPQRPGQDPPVARTTDIEAFVREALRAADGCLRFADLSRMAWSALRPGLAAAIPHARSDESLPNVPSSAKDDDYLIVRALQDLVEGLDPATGRMVRLAYGTSGMGVRDIASVMGRSKSAVARDLRQFRDLLGELLAGFDLSGDDWPYVAAAIRDILDS